VQQNERLFSPLEREKKTDDSSSCAEFEPELEQFCIIRHFEEMIKTCCIANHNMAAHGDSSTSHCKTLSRDRVAIDGLWIGNRIY
jgi:hypothetical protein